MPAPQGKPLLIPGATGGVIVKRQGIAEFSRHWILAFVYPGREPIVMDSPNFFRNALICHSIVPRKKNSPAKKRRMAHIPEKLFLWYFDSLVVARNALGHLLIKDTVGIGKHGRVRDHP